MKTYCKITSYSKLTNGLEHMPNAHKQALKSFERRLSIKRFHKYSRICVSYNNNDYLNLIKIVIFLISQVALQMQPSKSQI